MDIPRQTFHTDQKMRKKIPHLLIAILSQRKTEGKWFLMEIWVETGLQLRGLKRNQIRAPNFIYENYRRNKINTLSNFESQTPTHLAAAHAISKKFKIEFPGNWTKIFISPKSAWFTESVWIFLNKNIARRKKLCRFLTPEFNLPISVHFFHFGTANFHLSRF